MGITLRVILFYKKLGIGEILILPVFTLFLKNYIVVS